MVLNVALCGLGVVGGGVANILKKHQSNNVIVLKALVRCPERHQELIAEKSVALHTDVSLLFEEPSVDCISAKTSYLFLCALLFAGFSTQDLQPLSTVECVLRKVELIGGTDCAWDIIKAAITQGKHVVTANKAVVALRMKEIIDLLKVHPDVHFHFGAAVCGGLPIITLLRRSLRYDNISCISGILNGTTNYILTQMECHSKSFPQALEAAQESGYAEANPESDISGQDAQFKIAILAHLAFGIVPVNGIKELTPLDFVYAKRLGKTIKLLATAERVAETNDTPQVAIRVAPTLVPLSSPFSRVVGAMNGVQIQSEYLGTSFYEAQGAGRYPTASAVIADVMDISSSVENKNSPRCTFRDVTTSVDTAQCYTPDAFYIRFHIETRPKALSRLMEAFAAHDIALRTVLTEKTDVHNTSSIVFITERCSSNLLEQCLQTIENPPLTSDFALLQAKATVMSIA